mmetsp:Transcript_28664/g.87804  ORF Transcript_28664/g.87804 Transcript_28664/m.87804 type:complete len:91 (+) Transcript_28664:1160-1432(+)
MLRRPQLHLHHRPSNRHTERSANMHLPHSSLQRTLLSPFCFPTRFIIGRERDRRMRVSYVNLAPQPAQRIHPYEIAILVIASLPRDLVTE